MGFGVDSKKWKERFLRRFRILAFRALEVRVFFLLVERASFQEEQFARERCITWTRSFQDVDGRTFARERNEEAGEERERSTLLSTKEIETLEFQRTSKRTGV